MPELTVPQLFTQTLVDGSKRRWRVAWRRGRDSNPRYGCPYAAFRVRCIQPLCHLSIGASAGKPRAPKYLAKAAERNKVSVLAGRASATAVSFPVALGRVADARCTNLGEPEREKACGRSPG